MQFTRRQLEEIWGIGRDSWIIARGNPKRAMEISRARCEKTYGDVIGALQLIAVIMQILYLLYKFWSETKTVRPSRVLNDEVMAMLLSNGVNVVEEDCETTNVDHAMVLP